MKTVLLPVHPDWLELILSGEKTVEVRKTKPREAAPFRVLLYCTKGPIELARDKNGNIILLSRNKKADISDLEILSGKVIAECVCDKILEIVYGIEEGVYFDGECQDGFPVNGNGNNPTCLSFTDLEKYLQDEEGYGWHISDLQIYDKPKELSEFYKTNILSYDDWLYGIYNGRGGATASYESYKNFFRLKRPPQSWCYVEGGE